MTYFRRWFAPAAAIVFRLSVASAQPQYLITTIAGGVPAPTAAVATSYPLDEPNSVAADRFGNTYVSTSLNCVFRIDAGGMIERIAGNGQVGFSGDGGNALNAQLNNPQGLALDTAGNLYIADQYNQRVRMVDLTGTITTIAGTGTGGYNGDNQPATSAELYYPQGIAVDAAGNVYIADFGNQRIREVVVGGNITTIAGTGVRGSAGDGGPATSATLSSPGGVAVDSAGGVYIADANSNIRKVIAGGMITHAAGTGAPGYSGDGGLAVYAALSFPAGLNLDPTGNLYIADQFNQRIRKVDLYGIITTFAGGGTGSGLGDGGPATNALLNRPLAVAADSAGDLYIADNGNNRVREVNSSGNIVTAAGTGTLSFGGDGGPALLAQFSAPQGIARDGAGDLYIADTLRVRQIATNGVVSTVAGNGTCCNVTNGQSATSAGINPVGITVDGSGDVYFGNLASAAEVSNGFLSLVAGTGTPGDSGIPGPAAQAKLSANIPGVAVDPANLFISDSFANLVLEVTGGNIAAVAGTGAPGYNGDGGSGATEELNSPGALALDASGSDLYIADRQNNRVRLLTGGAISTVAGDGGTSDSGDGGAATAASISTPQGITLDGSGNLYVATQGNTIREISGGNITTIAGTGTAGYTGDGGAALSALLNSPVGLASDPAGNIYFSDSGNNAIRVLQPVAGLAPIFTVSTSQQGAFTAGQTGAVYQVVVGNAALAGPSNGQVVKVTELVPAGLTFAGMSGNGWQCSSNTCQRSDVLPPRGQYDAIAVVVNVSGNPPPQVTNAVTLYGGGSLGAASSVATFIGSTVPALEISATSSGNFFQGHSGTYVVTVGNQTAAASTTNAVVVTEELPATGLTLLSMSGTGWTCSTNSCSRPDSLPGGGGYPPIDVVATISGTAPSQVTNPVMVSGGGSASATTSVTTPVSTLTCAIDHSTSATITDLQILINEALGVTPAMNDLDQDGAVTVADVQIEINAALGMPCFN